ncbi:MAG: hypothetical protein WDN45_16150 [Caulobacteraceae bacterium]
MQIDKIGSFEVGGRLLEDGKGGTQSCDHGFVEYRIPHRPRGVSLLLWHSSSTEVWQNRWDGGEGYESIFLRRGYSIYLWDGPRVGRANWGCESITYKPAQGQDQRNFIAWRFGPKYPDFYPACSFRPTTRRPGTRPPAPRYDEFDTWTMSNCRPRPPRRPSTRSARWRW